MEGERGKAEEDLRARITSNEQRVGFPFTAWSAHTLAPLTPALQWWCASRCRPHYQGYHYRMWRLEGLCQPACHQTISLQTAIHIKHIVLFFETSLGHSLHPWTPSCAQASRKYGCMMRLARASSITSFWKPSLPYAQTTLDVSMGVRRYRKLSAIRRLASRSYSVLVPCRSLGQSETKKGVINNDLGPKGRGTPPPPSVTNLKTLNYWYGALWPHTHHTHTHIKAWTGFRLPFMHKSSQRRPSEAKLHGFWAMRNLGKPI